MHRVEVNIFNVKELDGTWLDTYVSSVVAIQTWFEDRELVYDNFRQPQITAYEEIFDFENYNRAREFDLWCCLKGWTTKLTEL